MKIYTAIGSRETPAPIIGLMEHIGKVAATRRFVLRSGRCHGADQAFEKGCDAEVGGKEIFLPVPNFPFKWNDSWRPDTDRGQVWSTPNPRAIQALMQFRPKCMQMKDFARAAYARNIHQVLGWELNLPSDFVVGWAPLDYHGFPTGGTAFTFEVATKYRVPVFNLASKPQYDSFLLFMDGGF